MVRTDAHCLSVANLAKPVHCNNVAHNITACLSNVWAKVKVQRPTHLHTYPPTHLTLAALIIRHRPASQSYHYNWASWEIFANICTGVWVRKSNICGSEDYSVNDDICNDNDDVVGTPVHGSGLPTLSKPIHPPVVDHTHPSDQITSTRRTWQMESTFANNTHRPVTTSAV